ncbi:MAG: hypothetical protein QN173_05360 [Armatimonadota bacterium]|nr:hypothetical protein [Armatimonadota bacterium]MDR7402654.1 hypothetical protein [Armatimonadota bacterium]MDR7404894.1 hypothetical protein [Armatimonadota bacterium]MDR7436744.1 hypothetical protein [Armatimonadota bacterium]MDR7472691.1 hypothetical protein [Armatimonadota bacterium]
MIRIALVLVMMAVLAGPAAARVGDPLATFAASPLLQQLQLTPFGQMALSGELAGRVLHRYVSDDGALTVDLVVRAGVIEQQILYLPRDARRGHQVSFFLQDALGSVVGAQQGLLGFQAAVSRGVDAVQRFGGYTMRFTPLGAAMLRVAVSR